jgi:hypothetical protein
MVIATSYGSTFGSAALESVHSHHHRHADRGAQGYRRADHADAEPGRLLVKATA